ncbi:hypothetical protein CHS0354_002087 [Potamilus streckersoni]|uniref:ABC transmembrane type-1 domain-containing protein n=1 Tax=Potamilus streckersoni TaxID=2493646 RepID=A0AAE0T6K8_9BIVA|nr:hypothetical protein CHS0354_002087 [Potamilus streckersoni]
MRNTLYTNDNLFILHGLNSELVDLIYLDPPFNSKRTYSAPIGSKAAGSSFKDMWTWQDVNEAYLDKLVERHPYLVRFIQSVQGVHSKAMMAYLTYMTQRIIEMHRILKNSGSLYLHCDPTASHYLKVVLDEIFGKSNFRNEVIWHYKRWTNNARDFSRMHDIILRYSKSKDYYYNQLYKPYSQKTVHRRVSVDGKTNLDETRDIGRGTAMDDVWDIPYIHSQSKERTGYPTQKPLALMERIIKASSKPGTDTASACNAEMRMIDFEIDHIIPKSKGGGYDVREKGSKNIGMTNVMRTEEKLPGIFTFLGDFHPDLHVQRTAKINRGLLYAFTALWTLAPLAAVTTAFISVFVICLQPCKGATETLHDFLMYPGVMRSFLLSVFTGLLSCFTAYILACALYIAVRGTRGYSYLRGTLMPVLAFPHAAFAFGTAFLLAQGGWISRIVEMISPGFLMPEYLQPYDNRGIFMTISLALREVPFILFLFAGSETDKTVERFLQTGAALGYSRPQTVFKAVLPALYPKIRFGLMIVLCYSVSVADVAVILGPSAPPTLSLMLLNFYKETDPHLIQYVYLTGALLLVAVCSAFIIWRIGEILVSPVMRSVQLSGNRSPGIFRIFPVLPPLYILLMYAIALVMLLWAFAFRWRFPDMLPSDYTLDTLMSASSDIIRLMKNSTETALYSVTISAVLTVLVTESLIASGVNSKKHLVPFYQTLILPEILIISGLYLLSVLIGWDMSYGLTVFFHTLFVFPYMLMSFSGNRLKLNERYALLGRLFGHGFFSVLFRIKLPLLIKPLLYACAVGFFCQCQLVYPDNIFYAGDDMLRLLRKR